MNNAITDNLESRPQPDLRRLDRLGLDPFEFRLFLAVALGAENEPLREGLPSLAARCGMSLTKARAAKRLLITAGLIKATRRAGYPDEFSVRPPNEWAAPDALAVIRQQTPTKSSSPVKSNRATPIESGRGSKSGRGGGRVAAAVPATAKAPQIDPHHPAAKLDARFQRYAAAQPGEVSHLAAAQKFWPGLVEAELSHLWVGPRRMDFDPAILRAAGRRLREQDKPYSPSDVVIYLQNLISGHKWAALEALKLKGDEMAAADSERPSARLNARLNGPEITSDISQERLTLLMGGYGIINHEAMQVTDPDSGKSHAYRLEAGRAVPR